jgi:hypothetical protein
MNTKQVVWFNQKDGFHMGEDPSGEWLEDETQEQRMKRSGFTSFRSIGEPDYDSFWLVSWTQLDGDLVIAELSDVCYWTPIVCANEAEFTALLLRLEPVLRSQNDVNREIVNAMKKTFHAWHGHGLEDPCRECDPDEVERRNEFRRKMAAKKAGQP